MVFILIDASLPIFGSLLCYVPTYFCYAVNIRSDMLIHKSYAFRLKWFISLVFLRMICCITLREITTPILYSICFLKWNFEKEKKCFNFPYFSDLRKVYPYYFTFTTFTKGRWVGERILDVFAREFRAHPAEEYVSRRLNFLMNKLLTLHFSIFIIWSYHT